MEDSVASSLNVFDIIARLVPGALFIVLVTWGLGKESLFDQHEPLLVLTLLLGGYIVGALLRVPARYLSQFSNYCVYGGNPRDCYLVKSKKAFGKRKIIKCLKRRNVLEDAATRELGNACSEAVQQSYPLEKLTSSFLFGFMISYLEVKGLSAKEDRMCSLSIMSSSLALVFLVSAVLIGFCKLNVLLVVACVLCFFISMGMSVHFEEIRFKTVIRSFALTYEGVRGVLAKKQEKNSADGMAGGMGPLDESRDAGVASRPATVRAFYIKALETNADELIDSVASVVQSCGVVD